MHWSILPGEGIRTGNRGVKNGDTLDIKSKTGKVLQSYVATTRGWFKTYDKIWVEECADRVAAYKIWEWAF